MMQRIRVPLGFVVAAAVLYFAAPTGSSIAAGLPVALAGLVFRGLAAGVIRKDCELATSGPYAWTRNPLYFGTFLLVLGFAVMSANLIAAALLVVPFCVIYPKVIQREEAHLERLFPEEFHEYCQQVPQFFPRFGGRPSAFSFAQYMSNREYNAALGLLAAVLVFFLKWLGRGE